MEKIAGELKIPVLDKQAIPTDGGRGQSQLSYYRERGELRDEPGARDRGGTDVGRCAARLEGLAYPQP